MLLNCQNKSHCCNYITTAGLVRSYPAIYTGFITINNQPLRRLFSSPYPVLKRFVLPTFTSFHSASVRIWVTIFNLQELCSCINQVITWIIAPKDSQGLLFNLIHLGFHNRFCN